MSLKKFHRFTIAMFRSAYLSPKEGMMTTIVLPFISGCFASSIAAWGGREGAGADNTKRQQQQKQPRDQPIEPKVKALARHFVHRATGSKMNPKPQTLHCTHARTLTDGHIHTYTKQKLTYQVSLFGRNTPQNPPRQPFLVDLPYGQQSMSAPSRVQSRPRCRPSAR